MGFIVEAKLLRFGHVFLFQRDCNLCGEKYLFSLEETNSRKGECFVCERCKPTVPQRAEWTVGNGGIKITGCENRVVLTYNKERKSTRNFAKVLKRDHFICQYCDNSGDTIDHIIPVLKSGGNNLQNLVCSCRRCNSVLSSLYFKTFWDKKEYLLNKIGYVAKTI